MRTDFRCLCSSSYALVMHVCVCLHACVRFGNGLHLSHNNRSTLLHKFNKLKQLKGNHFNFLNLFALSFIVQSSFKLHIYRNLPHILSNASYICGFEYSDTVNWCMLIWCPHNLCSDSSSFMWQQPCNN